MSLNDFGYSSFVSHVSTVLFRKTKESDRAWARRRKSASVQHRKDERQRFRESQRTGHRFIPRGIDFANRMLIGSLDVGTITVGKLSAGAITSHQITGGR